ncbi:MAG: hypothetical protein ACI87E_003809 [Mariniblastus sp.]|jgi:hypothetical protein
METTLHRQLKNEFCDPGAQIEVKLGRYIIDVVCGERLIEIQRSSLSSIRDKIGELLQQGYTVEVVKPLVVRKRLIKLSGKGGNEVDRRWSPTRGTILDLFDELIYFTNVFPHPNLTLIAPMIQIEEVRYPGRGRRRRRRKDDFVIQDRHIVELEDACFFRTVHDLHALLPKELPETFDTKHLSKALKIPRHQAQKINYVMRKTGAVIEVGRQGNAIQCRLATAKESKKALAQKKPKKKAPLKKLIAALEKNAALAAAAEEKKLKKKTPSKKKTTTKKATPVKSSRQKKPSKRKKPSMPTSVSMLR